MHAPDARPRTLRGELLPRRGGFARGGSRGCRRPQRQFAGAPSNHYSTLARFHELNKLGNFGKLLELRLGTLHCLRKIEIRPEEQTISALELANDVLRKSVPLETDTVETVELHGIPHRLEERWDVLGNARAASDETESPDANELVNRGESGNGRLLVDHDVPGELYSVGENHSVADVTIMGKVHVGHEET